MPPQAAIEKPCSRCRMTKPLEQFPPDRKMRLGRASHCHACNREKQRLARLSDPTFVARESVRAEERRRRKMRWIFDYLREHPCVDCGEADPVVLEFDHVRGEKFATIARMAQGFSLAKVRAEIAKCDVRCANCHRRKTASQLGWYAYMDQEPTA